jgi:hypothetical protein
VTRKVPSRWLRHSLWVARVGATHRMAQPAAGGPSAKQEREIISVAQIVKSADAA